MQSNAYGELNEHHKILDDEQRQKEQASHQTAQQHRGHRAADQHDANARTSAVPEEVDPPNNEPVIEAAEQKRRAAIVAHNDHLWRLEFGDDAERPASYLAEEQRLLAKGPGNDAQDQNDLLLKEMRLEQERRIQTQHTADREADKGAVSTAEVAPPSSYQSFAAENEKGNEPGERDQGAQHAEFVSRLAEKGNAQRQREQDGNER